MASTTAMRDHWNNGQAEFGLWAALLSPFAVELVAGPGIGYICVDQQHGLIDYADVLPMFTAAEGRGITALTRVPA